MGPRMFKTVRCQLQLSRQTRTTASGELAVTTAADHLKLPENKTMDAICASSIQSIESKLDVCIATINEEGPEKDGRSAGLGNT